jgi:hypothetical protein
VDDRAGLWGTYIGSMMSDETRLGRHDSSQKRSVQKAEAYLIARLRKLLLLLLAGRAQRHTELEP